MLTQFDVIKNFEFKESKDYYIFAGIIRQFWNEDYGYYRLWGNKLWLSTGGWSENEYVMSAVQSNRMWQMACWEEERRGGHYKYELPKKNFK